MNEFYQTFVETAQALAAARGLPWALPCDGAGKVPRGKAWDLGALAGVVPPPFFRLTDLGFDSSGLAALNEIRKRNGLIPVPATAMPSRWRDIFQAAVLTEVLIKKNKPRHALDNIGRHIRLLAACADDRDPWDITGEDVQLAYNAALAIGTSGKIAANFAMVMRIVIDGQHLADRSPLARFCVPYPTEDARSAQTRVDELQRRQNTYRDVDKVRTELSQRKAAEKLPEGKAFWELVRILWTEKPVTLADHIRFAQGKIGVLTGFRIGENATIPFDWERWREYADAQGRPAGERGGISRSLMLRHFAEKQVDDEGPEGVVLYETAQHIPQIFEQEVLDILRRTAEITRPMRERLRRQTETGRLFPEFEKDEVVSAAEMYIRVSGSLPLAEDERTRDLMQQYRYGYDPAILDALRSHQLDLLTPDFIAAMKKYWHRHIKDNLITVRDADGIVLGGRISWREAYFEVGDVEALIHRCMPTKLPDIEPFTLADGRKLYPYDLLFLMPIRALAENRNHGLTDVNWYFACGRISGSDLQMHLGGQADNLFARYGETDEDRNYTINNHSLRHLQNAELFRLGVADTIITKRFNRTSVQQSYEYDHRSLAEDLHDIDLPPIAEEKLGPRAQEAMRMIMAKKVSGPIVAEFLRVQREHGDDAAFDYLDAEADGLHVTPYGFCLNSFTVDPCPKHLECFNGCHHLTRSEVPEERKNLEQLRNRMQRAVAKIERTKGGIGRDNQLRHAKERLANIDKAIAAAPGTKPFPGGRDLFTPVEAKLGGSVLDGHAPRRSPDDLR
ncbi:hypothetical protein [Caenispirillum bisanense]|uniref:hypothetical protein n=1 Tax=Caenispirillum bisanense TaxID=414052 RepID=UPI0031E19ED7